MFQTQNTTKSDAEEAANYLKKLFLKVECEGRKFTEEDLKIISPEIIYSIQKDRNDNMEWFHRLKSKIKEDVASTSKILFLEARIKSLPSIAYKLIEGTDPLDTFAIKVVTENQTDCYRLKEMLTAKYQMVYFKDRIYSPKPNGYRDLRLVVVADLFPVEILIQTLEMYKDATFTQTHEKAYPWKYSEVFQEVQAKYEAIFI